MRKVKFLCLAFFLSLLSYSACANGIKLEEVSQPEYENAYHRYQKHATPPLYKITDFNKAKKILKGVVVFGPPKGLSSQWSTEREKMVNSIKTQNGRVVKIDKNNPAWFLAYYPDLDFLEVDKEYAAVYGYNLKTGENEGEIGFPPDYADSPNGQYRINGLYNGQECTNPFLMSKKKSVFKRALSFDSACYLKQKFWASNTEFYFSTEVPNEKSEPILKYFKVSVP